MTQHTECTASPTPAVESTQAAGPSEPGKKQQAFGCRWIHGDVGQPGWCYCQRPRMPDRSYCAEHHARSINPTGDGRYAAEEAECEIYLRDLPPPNDEMIEVSDRAQENAQKYVQENE